MHEYSSLRINSCYSECVSAIKRVHDVVLTECYIVYTHTCPMLALQNDISNRDWYGTKLLNSEPYPSGWNIKNVREEILQAHIRQCISILNVRIQ